jgi:3-deoxy-D-manno-octulosonic-acid transferase
MMADARAPRLPRPRDAWIPGVVRGALAAFSWIGAMDEPAALAFRRAGAAAAAVSVTGRLEEPSTTLTCNEAERASLATTFATRPVWFAAALPEAEEAAVFAAHRAVLQHSHRLLLILLPQHPDQAAAAAQRAGSQGWDVALRSAEEEPAPQTEVYLVDNPAEIGLWYRLAPVSSWAAACRAPAASATRWRPRRLARPSCTGRAQACTEPPLAGWVRPGRRGRCRRPRT